MLASILSHANRIRESLVFGPYVPVFCPYTVRVYKPYISGFQAKYPVSMFVRTVLINRIMVGFNIIY